MFSSKVDQVEALKRALGEAQRVRDDIYAEGEALSCKVYELTQALRKARANDTSEALAASSAACIAALQQADRADKRRLALVRERDGLTARLEASEADRDSAMRATRLSEGDIAALRRRVLALEAQQSRIKDEATAPLLVRIAQLDAAARAAETAARDSQSVFDGKLAAARLKFRETAERDRQAREVIERHRDDLAAELQTAPRYHELRDDLAARTSERDAALERSTADRARVVDLERALREISGVADRRTDEVAKLQAQVDALTSETACLRLQLAHSDQAKAALLEEKARLHELLRRRDRDLAFAEDDLTQVKRAFQQTLQAALPELRHEQQGPASSRVPRLICRRQTAIPQQ